MPLPPGEEEEKNTEENAEPKLQFSYVECLIFAFHQLAKKVHVYSTSTLDSVHFTGLFLGLFLHALWCI